MCVTVSRANAPLTFSPSQDVGLRKQSVRTAATKQKKVMHEVDLGAACMVPGIECPGFELHYWRKWCKHCGYSREDHDVDYVPGVYVRPGAVLVICPPRPLSLTVS